MKDKEHPLQPLQYDSASIIASFKSLIPSSGKGRSWVLDDLETFA